MNLNTLYNCPVIEEVIFIDDVDFDGYKTNWWYEFTGIMYDSDWEIDTNSEQYQTRDRFKQHLITGASHDEDYALNLYKYTFDNIPFAFGFGYEEDIRELDLYVTNKEVFEEVRNFLTKVLIPKKCLVYNYVGSNPDLIDIIKKTLTHNFEYNIKMTDTEINIIENI